MKVEEFEKKLSKIYAGKGFRLPVYWYLDEKDNVVVDFDSIREEYEYGIKQLKEILK